MADFSLLFDGTNDIAAVADANTLDGYAAGTIEVWFKTSYEAGYQKIFRKDGSIDIGISQAFGGAGSSRVFAEIIGVGNLGEFNGSYADGAWHHLAVVWDATILKGYIDGVERKSASPSGSAQDAGSTQIYLANNAGNEFFNGRLDEIRFSNIVRYTGAFTTPTAKFVSDANTMMLLHLDEGVGATAQDSSTNNNDLTLDATNPPSWSSDTPGLTDPSGAGRAASRLMLLGIG